MSKEKQSVSGTKTAARVLLAAVFVLLTAVCVFAGAGAAFEVTTPADIDPSGPLNPDENVTGYIQLKFPSGDVSDVARVYFNTDLTNATWTLSIGTGEGVPLQTRTLQPEHYNFISGYDLTYGSTDIIMDISITGTVSPVRAGQSITVMKIEASEAEKSGILSWSSPTQTVTQGLANAEDGEFSLSADSVNVGVNLIATVYGLPGVTYTLSVPQANITFPEQKGVNTDTPGQATFIMPATGYSDITLKAVQKTNGATITLTPGNDKETIEIRGGTLTNPIVLTSVPTVVAQGEGIVVEGTALETDSVLWYLLGNNYFEAGVENVINGAFTITIGKKWTASDYTDVGQYFLVVQSPMYDGLYSIAPESMAGMRGGGSTFTEEKHLNYSFKSDYGGVYRYSGGALAKAAGYSDVTLINMRPRGANAAQELCNTFDSAGFDDMYARASFIVGAPTSLINPIPAKVTQGEKITISGSTTGHNGDLVSVEFLSTAIAPVTTRVQIDGTWAVGFDTSPLDIGEYTVSITVGNLAPATQKLTVVQKEGNQPTAVPTTAPTAVPTIGTNPVFDNELTLFKGWNFISVPKKLASSSDTAGELFASVDTAGTPILSFDAMTKQWVRATSSTVISPLDAYWIYANGTYRLTPSFDTAPAVPVVKSVYVGWNAVGISAENSMTAKDAFNGVNWRTFSLWDAGNQRTGTVYNNGGSGAYSDEQFIPLYKGGWLYVNENGTVLGYA